MKSTAHKLWNTPSILLVLSTFFWAGNAISGKFLADNVPPLTLSLIRLAISALLIVPFMLPVLKREWTAAKIHCKLLLLLAVTGVIGFNLLAYMALHFTSATNVALFNSMSPMVTTLLAYVMIREKMNLRLGVSILISFAGIVWVMTSGSLANLLALRFNIGDLIMLAGVTSWSIYTINVKKIRGLLSPLAVFAYSLLIGLLLMIPASAVELAFIPVKHIGAQQVIGLLYLGIFPSIFAFLMWNQAVLLIGPSRSSLFQNLIPIFGAVLAYFILGEKITSAHYIGGLLVFMGVYFGQTRKSPQMSAGKGAQPQEGERAAGSTPF